MLNLVQPSLRAKTAEVIESQPLCKIKSVLHNEPETLDEDLAAAEEDLWNAIAHLESAQKRLKQMGIAIGGIEHDYKPCGTYRHHSYRARDGVRKRVKITAEQEAQIEMQIRRGKKCKRLGKAIAAATKLISSISKEGMS